ncbi:hypothetical protein Godav_025548, partial [Gossypium davidsonii]|nr:hypothetical protein [Gossypium davidsonii]
MKQLRTFKKVLWRVPTLHWLGEFISCCHDLAIEVFDTFLEKI